jgi:hypothetical protein
MSGTTDVHFWRQRDLLSAPLVSTSFIALFPTMASNNPHPTVVPPINLPRGARITDTVTQSLDVIEDTYYLHPLGFYSEDEWFSVSLIKRLFAERRTLLARIDALELQDNAHLSNSELMGTMMMLTPTKLRRNTLSNPVLLSIHPCNETVAIATHSTNEATAAPDSTGSMPAPGPGPEKKQKNHA